jgi:hypothetical protein
LPLPIRFRNEYRDQLIAASANLRPRLIHSHLNAKMLKRPAPSLGMQRIAIHQRPINIAQQYIGHPVS